MSNNDQSHSSTKLSTTPTKPALNTKAQSQPDKAATTATNEPRIVLKNQIQIRMDRFKLKVAAMKKNTSWKPKQPRIEEIEHVHFYYTFDENGRAQTYSVPTGGHFHKIEWHVDENGEFKATCGPALRFFHKKLANGTMKKIVEPVQFRAQQETEDGVVDYFIKDEHTHPCDYLYSEYMTTEMKREIQKNNQAQIPQGSPQTQSTAATGRLPAGFDLMGSKID